MDRIEPIRPRPPAPERIPAITRSGRTGEDRGRPQGDQGRRERDEQQPTEPPPDDGRPHIDVRV